MIEFFMSMEPPTVTAQEHKVTVVNGKPVFYDPPEVKNAKLKLCGHLAKYKPRKRIETGCRLFTKWCLTVVNGKPVFYDPPEVKNAKLKLCGHLAKYKPRKRIETGCRLFTKWCFKNDGKHQNGEYRITKPDTDNLQKMLKDCMTMCGFWKDDCLVASEVTEKFWADVSGIYIRIEEL